MPEGLDPEVLWKRHRLSIVGHIHHPQQIDAPYGRGILIPGSPEHHNFGDHGDRGWWVISIPEEGGEHSDDCSLAINEGLGCDCAAADENPQLEFVSGGSPEFLTVDTPADIQRDDNFYRVRTMAPGERLPEGVAAVAPTPTVVKHRDTLRGVAEVEQVLQVWLKEQPPEEGDIEEYLAAGRELLVSQEPTNLRDVRLISLSLQDFCCFADETLDVKEGVWLITGRGRDYPSNGAGKSTLVGEALYWLLFGRTTKGQSADEVLRWGADTCEVCAVFGEGQGELHVTRQRGPDGHTLSIASLSYPSIHGEVQEPVAWEATSVNEMTAKLGKYLGITPEIFQNLAYFSQEKLLLFSSATDGERKNVLADLIGLQAYQNASSAAGAEVSEQGREHLRVTTKIEMLEEQLVQAVNAVSDTESLQEVWEATKKIDIGQAKKALQQLEQEGMIIIDRGANEVVRCTNVAKDMIATHEVMLKAQRPKMEEDIRKLGTEEYLEKFGALKVRLATHTSLVLGLGFPSIEAAGTAAASIPLHQQALIEYEEDTELRELVRKAAANKVGAQTELVHLEKNNLEAAQQLSKAQESLSQGICPTCEQPISEHHRQKCLVPLALRKKDLEIQVTKKMEAVEVLVALEGAKIRQYEDVSQKIRNLRSLLAQLNKADVELREISYLEKQIEGIAEGTIPQQVIDEKITTEIAAGMATYTREQEDLVEQARRTVVEQQKEQQARIKQAQEYLARLQKETNPQEAPLKTAKKAQAHTEKYLATHREEILGIQKTTAIYEYWRTGFSKQGLQSLLVEEVAVRFNANRANIFPLLTQGIYDVQFSTLSKTRAGELREKTEFLVYEHGKPIPYGALSGGQRRRIDIGIMLVLTQAVAQWMGTRGVLGLLILDEVFGFLDASGAEGLLAALTQVKEQVPTIYVITHDTHLQSMVPNIIEVVQDANGISKVV